jgi:hypothetical protein
MQNEGKEKNKAEKERRLPGVKWRAHCRLHWLTVAEMVARLGGAASSRLCFSPVFFIYIYIDWLSIKFDIK